MKILVTGGAGYIGSFMTKRLLDCDFEVVVFDSLERGHRSAVDSRAQFIKGDIRQDSDLKSLFEKNTFDAIIHFAGYIAVGESELNPEKYYENNVIASKNLFNKAILHGVNKIIFSSSAAVYGDPTVIPIPENHSKSPTSEYGKNKLEVEHVLSALKEKHHGFSFVALRYFNAAGAALDESLGENHNPETHIIPLAIKSLFDGSEFELFGTDYNTPDGTCIRDYVHVVDLVEAHLFALREITNKIGGYFYNVGTGYGYSNLQVLEMIKKISGMELKIKGQTRRPGDADRLVADVTRIKEELGFVPKHSDLENIVKTAFAWHSRKLT